MLTCGDAAGLAVNESCLGLMEHDSLERDEATGPQTHTPMRGRKDPKSWELTTARSDREWRLSGMVIARRTL